MLQHTDKPQCAAVTLAIKLDIVRRGALQYNFAGLFVGASYNIAVFLMRDIDIRKALHATTLASEPGNLVVDEFSLCQGLSRVDVAIINGRIHGFEIKSERDTLERLPGQSETYSKALDTVTVVAATRHLKSVVAMIPEWWGVVEAVDDAGEVLLVDLRPTSLNPSVDSYAVAQLLWREEAIDVLKQLGLERGILTKPRREVWKRLAESVPVDKLGDFVRCKIKARVGWRSAQ